MADTLSNSRASSIKTLFSRKGRRQSQLHPVVSDTSVVYSPTKRPAVHWLSAYETKNGLVQSVSVQLPNTPRKPAKQSRQQIVPALHESPPGSYMFDAPPTLVKTPWEVQRNRRPAVQYTRPKPRRVPSFHELPRSVMHSIAGHLRDIHQSQGTVDVQSMQDDLCALANTSRRWHRIASEHLYAEVWLPSNEDQRSRVLSFSRRTTQLERLRRTLEERPATALAVRHLRLPYFLSREIYAQESAASMYHGFDTVRLIADIISLCPGLEHFSGFSAPDCETHETIWQALATRSMLKSHCWGLDPSWMLNTRELVDFHAGWQRLDTLALCDAELGTGTLFGILRFLPSLQNLLMRGLYGSGIHCATMLMMPPLKSLRLECLDGIADAGLEKLTYSKASKSLERLTLVDMGVRSLSTVQTLFDGLEKLTHFSLVQSHPPELDEQIIVELAQSDAEFAMGSRILKELCWDTSSAGSAVNIIADSIDAGFFPSLRMIKAPSDDEGAIQRVCRPIAQESSFLPDAIRLCDSQGVSPLARRSLEMAQIRAQLRTMQSKQQPSVVVVVQDEDDKLQRSDLFGSYMGDLASDIEYSLEPGAPDSMSVVPEFGNEVVPLARHGRERALDLGALF